MKLYFKKPITDSAKLKFLKCALKGNDMIGAYILEFVNKVYEKGYINLHDWSNTIIDKLKALDIWQEPRKFGRFWDYDKDYCFYGFLQDYDKTPNCKYKYLSSNEYYKSYDWYKNFEEIKSLEDLHNCE